MTLSKLLKSLLVVMCCLFQLSMLAQDVQPVVLHVETAGTLRSLFTANDKNQITSLTLTGSLNGTDIAIIREMAGCNFKGEATEGKLSVLDMAGARIVSGGNPYLFYGINYSTMTNVVSKYMFFRCSRLISVSIPNSVTSIQSNAFSGCTGLISVSIPNSVTSIESNAFSGCTSLETINYNAKNCISIYSANTNPFGSSLSGLKTVCIGSEVKNIPDFLFYGCTSLETINYNAKNCISIYSANTTPFGSLGGVQTINIGDSVRFIPNYLFSNCTRVREINSKAAYPPSIDATTFQGVSRNIPVYPPVAFREYYIFDPYWSEFFRIYAKDYVNNVVYLNKQMVTIMTVGSGYVLKQPVKSGESVSYLIQPESDFKIASLMVNGKNMLDSLDSNGYLNFTAIKEDINIIITPVNTDIENVVDKSSDNSISCWSADGKFFVVSNQEMEQVELIDLNGRTLIQEQNNAFNYVLKQPNQTVNVIRVRLTDGEIKAVKVKLN